MAEQQQQLEDPINIGTHSVDARELPSIIGHIAHILRMHMGDAAGTDALEVLAIFWTTRAEAHGPKKQVPWDGSQPGTRGGPLRHPSELQLRTSRTLHLIRNHENVEHWPLPICKFLTKPGSTNDALADENKMLRLCAKAARRSVATALTTLPKKLTKPEGPLAVSSSLRRSAACWQAEARSVEMRGFKEYLKERKAAAARTHELDMEIERDEKKKERAAARAREGERRAAQEAAEKARAAKALEQRVFQEQGAAVKEASVSTSKNRKYRNVTRPPQALSLDDLHKGGYAYDKRGVFKGPAFAFATAPRFGDGRHVETQPSSMPRGRAPGRFGGLAAESHLGSDFGVRPGHGF